LGGAAAHLSPFPDARLVLADRAVVVDHELGQVHALYLHDEQTRAEQEGWVERVRSAARVLDTTSGHPGGGRQQAGQPMFRHTELEYLDLIDQCQQQIRAGESYEICLTNHATWPGRVDEAALALAMREASPVPFAAWLRGP